MDSIRGYVISVVCAAIVSAIATNICSSKGTTGTIIRLLAGILMAVTVISPLASLRFEQLVSGMDEVTASAQRAARDGTLQADEVESQVIRQQMQAYVADRAAEFDAEITVDIVLSENAPHLPQQIMITGNISPYARKQLCEIIRDELGIPEDEQHWN